MTGYRCDPGDVGFAVMICGEVITLPSLLKELAAPGVSSALDGTDFMQPSPRAMLPAPPTPARFNAAPLAAVEFVGDITCLASRRRRCRRLPAVAKVAFERPVRSATQPLSALNMIRERMA
jgi:hypothetical protein